MDEIVQKTADALKIPRPAPFCEQQISNLQPRKMNLAACFTPDPSSPLDKDWVSVELLSSPNDVVKDPRRWRNQQGQFDLPMLSSLKNRLGIEGPHGRSYISNLGIEQRQALKSRGLHSNATADKIAAPATPPPRTPGKGKESCLFYKNNFCLTLSRSLSIPS